MTIASQVAYLMKNTYEAMLADEARRKHPSLMSVPKVTNWGGSGIHIYSVKTGNSQNFANGIGNLSLAQAIQSTSVGFQFQMVRQYQVGTAYLDVPTLLANWEAPDDSFEDYVITEVDGGIMELWDRLGRQLFADGNGVLGQIASISTNTIFLKVPRDARNFKNNMVVGASASPLGTGMRAGSTSVTSIDIDGGDITLTSAAGITGLAANDYLYAFNEVSNQLQGMELCTPFIAPTSGDSFRNVNRFANIALLAGSRVPIAQALATPHENAGFAHIKINDNGGEADSLTLAPQVAWQVIRDLNARVRYQEGGDLKYGGMECIVASPGGELRLIADPDSPITRGRVFDNASHEIKSLKELVMLGDEDGNEYLRQASADVLEARFRSMCNYWQRKPMNHAVFATSGATS